MAAEEWRHVCPQYLHRPFQFLWFESDELAIITMCFTLALLLGGKIWWGQAFVVPYVYIKLKKSYPRGFLKHALYAMGILAFRRYPVFFENRFIE